MREIGRDLYDFRLLIWRYVKRDLSAPYRQSYLGVVWAFVLPIVPVSVYIILERIRILNVQQPIPYALYAVIGFTLWMLFIGSISNAMNKVIGERAILTRTRYSLIVSLVTGYGKVLSEMLIRIMFVPFVFLWYGMLPSWHALALPVLVLPLLALSVGLGIVLSILNIVMRDTKNLVDVFARYGIFLCSVIFPLPATGFVGAVNDSINVVAHLINGIRDSIVLGNMENPTGYVISSVVALFVLVVALKGLSAAEHRVLEYV